MVLCRIICSFFRGFIGPVSDIGKVDSVDIREISKEAYLCLFDDHTYRVGGYDSIEKTLTLWTDEVGRCNEYLTADEIKKWDVKFYKLVKMEI